MSFRIFFFSIFLKYSFRLSEAVALRCFLRKSAFRNLQNSQENTCVRVSFLIKLLASILQNTSGRLLAFLVHISPTILQKQPPEVFYEKDYSQKFHMKFYMKTPVPQACSFIEKETLTEAFPVKFAEFLRTVFLQNTSGRLLLTLELSMMHGLTRCYIIYLF